MDVHCAAMPDQPTRMPLVDALKGVSCLLILWHHLAFYGPMSDAVHGAAPGLIDWLYEYARMAVQVFLVVGGYLTAGSLAPDLRPRIARPGATLWKRYLRLSVPCVAALTLAIACSAVARQLMSHDSISASPTLGQLIAHALLAQHLLGFEALSAGIWYVSIDFQLFALTVAALLAASAIDRGRGPANRLPSAPVLVAALTAASLFAFNLDERLDDTALYFYGAYGLGMLARWSGVAGRQAAWIAAVAALGTAALAFEFRPRIAIALAAALLLAWGQRSGRATRWALPDWLGWLGLRSYAIFLVHFPVSLVVSGIVTRLWPGHLLANALGMAGSCAASLAAAAVFYRAIEAPPEGNRPGLRFHTGFLATGIAAMLAEI